jgi:hypothetical protein
MPLITDYTTLQQAITLFGKRKDITDNLVLLIQLAEPEILTDLLLGGTELVTTALFTTPGLDTIALPSDYQSARSFASVAPSYPLKLRSPSQLYSGWAAGAQGPPQEYAILGRGGPLGVYQMQVRPTPGAAYVIRAVYDSKLAPLSTTSTNWLLTAYPNLYLWGALRMASALAIDDERIPLWQAAYDKMIRTIKANNEEALYPNGLQMNVVDESVWSESGFGMPANTDVVTAIWAGASSVAGDFVNLFDTGAGTPGCRLANAALGTIRVAHGFVSAVYTNGQIATVALRGNNTFLSGLVIGNAYLSNAVAGKTQAIAVTGSGNLSQVVGTVVSPTTINVEIDAGTILP